MPILLHSRALRTASIALAAATALSLTGCLGSTIRSMSRNENDGVGGAKVYDVQIPYYQPSKLLPAGVTRFTVGSVPESYELLLDLNMDPEVARQRTGKAGDVSWWSGAHAETGIDGQGAYASASSNERSIADNPYAQFGAAAALRDMRAKGTTYQKKPLAQKVDQGGQVELHFIHEVVSISKPDDEIGLEPFGKVLSVTTGNNGEMISQTREPVYTMTIPSKHRLVVVVKEPGTGKEQARAIYASWSKNLKYYRNSQKKFFTSPEEAAAGYEQEKDVFAKTIAAGPLFDSKRPKNLKELPVTDLSAMSAEDVYGTLIISNSVWLMLPDKGDSKYAAIRQGLEPWLSFGSLSAELKNGVQNDSAWLPKAEAALQAIADDAGSSAQAKAVAYLDLATLAAARLNGKAAGTLVAKAEATHPDILSSMNWVGSGGALDYGKFYYRARDAWKGIEAYTEGIANWYRQGLTNAVINPSR